MAYPTAWTVMLVLCVTLADALPREILQETIPNYAPPLSPEQPSPPPASSTRSSPKMSLTPVQQSPSSPPDTGEGNSALIKPMRAARSCVGELWCAFAPETVQVQLWWNC